MTGTRKKALIHRRDHLNTIAAVLPMERRNELAELLTDQDVETLRHLVNQGMGENTLRALTSDLAYLEAWSLAAMGTSPPWPAPEALLLKFVAHHLWDGEKRMCDPQHGMPIEVEDKLRAQNFLRSTGPHPFICLTGSVLRGNQHSQRPQRGQSPGIREAVARLGLIWETAEILFGLPDR